TKFFKVAIWFSGRVTGSRSPLAPGRPSVEEATRSGDRAATGRDRLENLSYGFNTRLRCCGLEWLGVLAAFGIRRAFRECGLLRNGSRQSHALPTVYRDHARRRPPSLAHGQPHVGASA